MNNTKILVTGATGLSGTLIVKELASRQTPVLAMVRDQTKATFLRSLPQVTIIEGDMLKPGSMPYALGNVERALLISTANDQMLETQCSFIDACKAAGVRHVIKFSGEESQIGYDPQKFRFTREHEQIENYLENSGLQWTHLRPSQFMQVYLRETEAIKNKGGLFLPLDGIQMSPVDLQDVAKIAALLLIHGGHQSEVLRMTGPETLSMAGIAAIISGVTGKVIRYVPVSIEERSQALLKAGVPPYLVEAIKDQTAERCSHPQARVDLSTHELFGIIPTTFKQFAERHATDFGKN
jgi:uncharacterized protein YbjT (DUF2867 family)